MLTTFGQRTLSDKTTIHVLECTIYGFVEQLALRRIIYGTSCFHRSLLSGESIYRFIDPVVIGTVLIQLYTHINGCRILRKTQSCRAWISLQPSMLDRFRCTSFSSIINDLYEHPSIFDIETSDFSQQCTPRQLWPIVKLSQKMRVIELYIFCIPMGSKLGGIMWEKLQQYPKRARFSTKSLVTLPDFYDPGLLIRNIIIKK